MAVNAYVNIQKDTRCANTRMEFAISSWLCALPSSTKHLFTFSPCCSLFRCISWHVADGMAVSHPLHLEKPLSGRESSGGFWELWGCCPVSKWVTKKCFFYYGVVLNAMLVVLQRKTVWHSSLSSLKPAISSSICCIGVLINYICFRQLISGGNHQFWALTWQLLQQTASVLLHYPTGQGPSGG